MKSGSRISFGLILLLIPVLLCSCNIPDPVPTVTPTPDWTATPVQPTATATLFPTATPTPVPEFLEIDPEHLAGTKLSLKFCMDGKEKSTLEKLVESFNEENPEGITVQAENILSVDELGEQVVSNRTDIVIADSSWLRSLNTEGGLYLDLSAFLNDQNLSLSKEDIQPLMPVMLETEKQKESYYALPLWADPAFLFYNKTWAIELGFPDTPSDLASFAEQVCAAGKANYQDKDESKHGTGGWIVSSDPEDVMSWLLAFTQNGETPGDIMRSSTGNLFEDTAAWLRNLYDNGCAWISRVKEPYDYFANRYSLVYSGTYSDAERQFNAFDQSEEHSFDNWDLILYPSRSGKEKTDPRIYADIVSIAIPDRGDAKAANAAWHFIRWLFRNEHAAELSLAALGWPVQDNDAVTKLYRNSGEDKLYQTLSFRQYLANSDNGGNWLTDQRILSDGFAYIFNPSAKPEDIADIWEQIGSIIAEVDSVNHLSDISSTESTILKGVNNETQP